MLMLVTPAAGRAADGQWQFGSSPSFSTGKYGSDARTEVLHTPITARRLFRDGDISLVFPFTCIRGNGSVTVVNGSPVRQEPSTRPGGGAEAPRGTVAAEDTNCGMGDIIVRGRYYLVDEHGWMPTIAVRAHVKAPTASADRGLGTGRFDEGVGVEVSRTLAGQVLAMVDGGYTAIGRPTGVDYNNSWWYDLGAGRDIVRVRCEDLGARPIDRIGDRCERSVARFTGSLGDDSCRLACRLGDASDQLRTLWRWTHKITRSSRWIASSMLLYPSLASMPADCKPEILRRSSAG